MIRPSVLLFALLITAPAVYRYVLDEVDITAVLVRFLIAVPLAAIALGALRFVASTYINTNKPGTPVTPAPAPDADKRDRG
jgi:hypothetical protein